MMAGSASAEDINLHSTNGSDFRISLSASTVNGEKVDWIVNVPRSASERVIPTPDSGSDTTLRLSWRAPGNAPAQAAHFLLDLSKGRLDVIPRPHQILHLRCTNLLRRLAV
jgi:hypothetical protein